MCGIPRYGPDSRESWLVAALCGLLLFRLLLHDRRLRRVLLRHCGNLRLHEAGKASWPVSLNCALTLLAGTALSGLFVNANVLVSQHFERQRATACGLAFTAGVFYTVIFPTLAEMFRRNYGTRGAFLLYGTVLMNAVPVSIMTRSPALKLVQPGESKSYFHDTTGSYTGLLRVVAIVDAMLVGV
ncbi:hypothetical protein MRX96_026361 [Rhipicephalus microplus]